MFGSGATHRHAPFVGRTRELGLLTQLLVEGFGGPLHLVRVAGEPGSGRRRLLAEALHRGPDAEWVDLAPGGVEADLGRWARTELADLLLSYPDLAYPSWAVHVLARFEPSLARWAARPALSREALPDGDEASVIGAAAGAVLAALTAQTTVVVNAGIWPATGSDREAALLAAARAFRIPGAVMTAAIDRVRVTAPEPPETRTLMIPPLGPAEIRDLVSAWMPEAPSDVFAAWLARATGGLPFHAQETVRWLEELGHLRIDDDALRVDLLAPVERLPLPLGLSSVMAMRHARLPLAARYLLALIADHDGRLDLEEIHARYEADEETFDDALTVLRRREFLLARTTRRPLALASPLWRPLAAAPSRRRFPRRRPRHVEPLRPPSPPESPLALTARGIDALIARMTEDPEVAPALEIAALLRAARPRVGPAWAGLRGRLALLAAVARRRQSEPEKALAWARRGRTMLAPDTYPALRRSLGALALRILESEERANEAAELRRTLLDEALFAGHDVAAARLAGAVAEGDRRRGRLRDVATAAGEAERRLTSMGLLLDAELAWYSEVRALVDRREMDAALDRARQGPGFVAVEPLHHQPHQTLVPELEAAESPVAFLSTHLAVDAPTGRPFGLDDAPLERQAASAIGVAAEMAERRRIEMSDPAVFTLLTRRLIDAGLLTAAADLWELRLRAATDDLSAEALDEGVRRLARLHERFDAPSRSRHAAGFLIETRAGETPTFHRVFRPLLLHAAGSIDATLLRPSLRLVLFGRPRLERDGRTRPLPLWPAWWGDLVGAAIARALLGRTLSFAEAARLLVDAGYAPELPVEAAVDEANDILWDRSALPGGLRGQDGAIHVDWTGLWCDVREVMLCLNEAGRLGRTGRGDEASRMRRAALDLVAGPLLPSIHLPAAEELRAHLDARLAEAVSRELAAQPEPEGAVYARWGEGLFGAARSELATALTASRWSRVGRHLGPASGPRLPVPDESPASP